MAISGADFGMGVALELFDGFSRPSKKIQTNFTSLEKTIDKGGASISSTFDSIGNSFATAAASMAVTLPFASAIQKSMEFDAVLSDVGAKANATSEDMKRLRMEALKMGEATAFSAKEAAQGQAFLAQAGFNTEQIISALPATLNLASAGNLSLARSADIASNIMAQFGLRATDMGRITDVLALAANSANTNVEQLSEAMKFLAPTVNALGVPIEEATAAVQLLSNAGLQGSLGTRALGTSLGARLTKPTKEATKMMEKLGFSAFDTQGNFKGLANIFEDFGNRVNKLSPKMRLAAISTIFGGESLQEVTQLIGQELEVMRDGEKVILKGADALREFTRRNEQAAGTAERVARAKLDNLKGDVTLFQSAFETAMINLGAAFTPILRPIVQAFTDLTSKVSKFISTPLGQKVAVFAGALSGLAAALGAVSAVIPMLNTGFKALRVSVLAFSGTMLPITLAIGAAVGAFVLFHKSVSEFKKVMAGAEAATGFTGFLQKTGGLLLGVIEIFKTWNGTTFRISRNMKKSLEKTGMLEFFLDLSTFIVRGIEFVKGFVKEFMKGMQSLTPALNVLRSSVMGLINTIGQLFPEFKKLTSETGVWNAMGKALASVVNFIIVPAIESVIKAVNFFVKAMDFAISNTGGFVSRTVTFITKAKDTFIGFLSFTRKWGKMLVESIIDGVASMWGKLTEFFESKIKGTFGSVGSAMGSSIGRMFGGDTEGESPQNSLSLSDAGETATRMKRRIVEGTQQIVEKTTQEVLKTVELVINLDGETIAKKVNDFNDLDFARSN